MNACVAVAVSNVCVLLLNLFGCFNACVTVLMLVWRVIDLCGCVNILAAVVIPVRPGTCMCGSVNAYVTVYMLRGCAYSCVAVLIGLTRCRCDRCDQCG